MSEFDVDAFISGLDTDKTQEGGYNRITKILMNSRGNQGMIGFVPFLNKSNNNFYQTIEHVKEWQGNTTILNSGSAWYRILPLEYYGDLTEDQLKLYSEVVTYYDKLAATDQFGWDVMRTRNYSLFYGIPTMHTNTKDEELRDHIDKPCLMIFPSLSPIDALATSVSSKVATLKGRKDWIPGILNPTNTGRKGIITITFRKPAGPGYDSNVSFEMNSEYSVVIDPEKVFDEESVELFNDPIRDLLGWQGGEGTTRFNEDVMKELRKDLILAWNDTQDTKEVEVPLENKNGTSDPMKRTEESASAPASSTEGVSAPKVRKPSDSPF